MSVLNLRAGPQHVRWGTLGDSDRFDMSVLNLRAGPQHVRWGTLGDSDRLVFG